jgi:hypothetical protein
MNKADYTRTAAIAKQFGVSRRRRRAYHTDWPRRPSQPWADGISVTAQAGRRRSST